jgi:hypothetical protein
VHVVAAASDFPVPAPSDAVGLWCPGDGVYLVEHPTQDPTPVLLHEAYAHHGVRALLGPRGWSEFMLAVSEGVRGEDPSLYRAGKAIQRAYGNLRPRLRADEVIARVAEIRADPATGRLRVRNPMAKRWAALRGRIARDVLQRPRPASIEEVEGVLLETEALISDGWCATVPPWQWYRPPMSKPMGTRKPPRSWQESKDLLDAEKHRQEWRDQVWLTFLGIFFAVAIPVWFIYMGWATFDSLHWFFGH